MSKLTEEKKEQIQRLHKQGLSQDKISVLVGVSKPYVNAYIQSLKPANLDGWPAKPVNYNEVVPALGSRAFSLPLAATHLPDPQAHFGGTSAENYYLKKELANLEKRNEELKSDLSQERRGHELLKTEHGVLKIKHDTQAERHNIELERKDNEAVKTATSGLNGLADKAGKLIENPAIINLLTKIAAGKYGVTDTPQIAGAAGGVNHPSADEEVQEMYKEIQDVLIGYDKEKLTMIYGLFSIFLTQPSTLTKTHAELMNYVQTKQPV